MSQYSNVKKFKCNNSDSKFKHIFNEKVIKGNESIYFIFTLDSENCYWPVNSSLFELINDGWEEIK